MKKSGGTYVIRQPARRRGFFSLVASVACHIDFAIKNNLEPFVDFQTSKTLYNDGVINGSENAWDYYFKPVSSIKSLEEIKTNFVVSKPGFPPGYDFTLQQNPGLYHRVADRIVVQNDIENDVDRLRGIVGQDVLGVHFRGQEARYFRGHYLPPSKMQIQQILNRLIEEFHFKSIFVVSEDQSLLDFVCETAPVPVKFTNSFRLSNKNAYDVYPREQHRYLLGREILIDALLLSNCGGLIHCSSNVGQFARFACQDGFRARTEILNWQNTNVAPFNYFAWPVFLIMHKIRGQDAMLEYAKTYS